VSAAQSNLGKATMYGLNTSSCLLVDGTTIFHQSGIAQQYHDVSI
jgi:hypothetical protein